MSPDSNSDKLLDRFAVSFSSSNFSCQPWHSGIATEPIATICRSSVRAPRLQIRRQHPSCQPSSRRMTGLHRQRKQPRPEHQHRTPARITPKDSFDDSQLPQP